MAAAPFTFLVVGEALIDIVRRYGDAPVEHVGGSPANVAVGLARLDGTVRLATCLGTDERGRRIREHLERHGVEVDSGSADEHPTSTALATIDSAGAATYEFDLYWDTGRIELNDAVGHLHTGSIAAVLPPGGEDVLEALHRARGAATVSYDPNVRPGIMGDLDQARARIEEVIALADVVKASSDDLALLYPELSTDEVLTNWGALGPALTVATLADKGVTYRVTGTGEIRTLPAPPVQLVDTVGAGDSFMAGLISGLAAAGMLGGAQARAQLGAADADAIQPAVERGGRCGAITVSRAGAYAPSLDEL